MKISFSYFCPECLSEQLKQGQEVKDKIQPNFEVELNEENLYEFTCPKGHHSITQLQTQKFEILFDLASLALLDGYTREAVSGYASALERFIEYYILVLSLKHSVPVDDFVKTWKLMAKQSERQLGAFFVLQLLEKKSIKWNESQVSFRNKVIHQGYLSTSEEALDYGQYVLSFIFSVLNELKDNCQEYMDKAMFIHLMKNGDKIPKGIRLITAGPPTLINLVTLQSADFGVKTLKQALESMKNNSFYRSFYKKSM